MKKLLFTKRLAFRLVTLLLSMLAAFNLFSYPAANAMTNSDLKSIIEGTPFYDGCEYSASNVLGNKNFFAVGDSILAGSKADLTTTLTASGYQNLTIDAVVGRSMNGAGHGPTNALEALTQNQDAIKNAGTILLILGTNPDNYDAAIPLFTKTIRDANADARIFWVNVGVLKDVVSKSVADNSVTANAAITKYASTYNYKTINWESLVSADLLAADGIHPVSAGVDKLVELILKEIGSATSAGTNPVPADGASQKEQNAAIIWNFFASKKLTSVQIAGIMGNLDVESAGTFRPDIVQNGGYSSVMKINGLAGYGIAQWTTKSRQQGLHDTMVAAGYPNRDDILSVQLDYFWTELTGGWKKAYEYLKGSTDIKTATWAIMKYYEGPRCQTPECLANRTTRSTTWYSKFNGTTGSALITDNSCESGISSVVAGDIAKTALNLAWHDKGHGKEKEDATPAFQETMPKHHTALINDIWSDCGAFVGTVIRASGADPEYTVRGTADQHTYVTTHPDKWLTFTYNGSTSELQPGDVLVYNNGMGGGHTMIYVGPYVGTDGKTYNTVDASHTEHVPQAQNVYNHKDFPFTVARLK